MQKEKLIFDYSKLRGLIIEKHRTLNNFAKVLNIDYGSLCDKLNNKRAFSQAEIYNICLQLGITEDKEYFFCLKC